jgi:hypothetical protein
MIYSAMFLAIATVVTVGLVANKPASKQVASDCIINGCKRDVIPPTYSPPVNNCGQYVVEGLLGGVDGSCTCPWQQEEPADVACVVENDNCAATKSYTITPANANIRVCEWDNYPTTPATWASGAYGAAYTVTLSVAGCGDEDEARAYLMQRPASGPNGCGPDGLFTCTATFKLVCNNCNKKC